MDGHLGEFAEQASLESAGIIDDDEAMRGVGDRFGVDEGTGRVTTGHVEFTEAAADDVFDEHARLRQTGHIAQLRKFRQQIPAAMGGDRIRGQQGGGHSISLIRPHRLPPHRLCADQPSAS